MGSQTVIFDNDGGKDALEINTYLREENLLLLHVALIAPEMRDVPLYLLFPILVFSLIFVYMS